MRPKGLRKYLSSVGSEPPGAPGLSLGLLTPFPCRSAFFLFCSEHRPKIKSEHPGLSIGDTAKKLGEMWSEQSAKDKQPYEQKAAKLKEKYEKVRRGTRARPTRGRPLRGSEEVREWGGDPAWCPRAPNRPHGSCPLRPHGRGSAPGPEPCVCVCAGAPHVDPSVGCVTQASGFARARARALYVKQVPLKREGGGLSAWMRGRGS